MLIAQFTDMHLKPQGTLTFGAVDTAAHLARCVAHVNALTPRPDAVLVTGDLTNDAEPEAYALLRDLLAPLPMPVYLIPGNHDDRAGLRAAFPDHAYLPDGDFLHYAVENHAVRLIGLDTIVPGEAGGEMCDARIAWLAETLAAAPERPTVVFMHHPPFPTGIAFMDAMGLDGRDAMAAVVRRHGQVERVLCGHLHRPIQVRWAGTIAATAPATAHQVDLALSDDAPAHWVMEPPAVQLHLWRPETGVISHTSYIGDFGNKGSFKDPHTPPLARVGS